MRLLLIFLRVSFLQGCLIQTDVSPSGFVSRDVIDTFSFLRSAHDRWNTRITPHLSATDIFNHVQL